MVPLHNELVALGTAVLGLGGLPPVSTAPPARVEFYYPGTPCPMSHVDRTFSQFQVNLDDEQVLLAGRLQAGAMGEAVLLIDERRRIALQSNASRVNWLLSYPFVREGVGIWGRTILGSGCATENGALYVESLFPLLLFLDEIDPRVDLMRRIGEEPLREGARAYGLCLEAGAAEPAHDDGVPGGRRRAAGRLSRALFDPEAARSDSPWRVLLKGSRGGRRDGDRVDVLLSGADGSTGMFGHIAVGSNGWIYNIYPKGSERGAPDVVPLWEYLFNAQRGQALQRPSWLLRLEELPTEVVARFDRVMRRQVSDIQEGRAFYHPTANNCTIASLTGLGELGFEVAKARYFTRRFPRPAFEAILKRLPRLAESGDLQVGRIELFYFPQVPHRPAVGGAPNRPLADRARVTRPEPRAERAEIEGP